MTVNRPNQKHSKSNVNMCQSESYIKIKRTIAYDSVRPRTTPYLRENRYKLK